MPALADVGVRTMINGPEAFTPDNEFCLGETEVGGFFVAAGFCAHGIAGAGGIGQVMAEWILDGDPGLDLWHMDVRRFGPAVPLAGYTLARIVENYETLLRHPAPGQPSGPAGRPLRTSPGLPVARRARRGVRREGRLGAGELLRQRRRRRRPTTLRPARLGRARLVAVRSARAPGRARGRGAVRRVVLRQDRDQPARTRAAFVAHAFAGNGSTRRSGAVTYTQALDDRGGIEMDVTVTRVAPDAFLVVTGTAFGAPRPGLAARPGPAGGFDAVRIADVTGAWACFGLWGPRARDVLPR